MYHNHRTLILELFKQKLSLLKRKLWRTQSLKQNTRNERSLSTAENLQNTQKVTTELLPSIRKIYFHHDAGPIMQQTQLLLHQEYKRQEAKK